MLHQSPLRTQHGNWTYCLLIQHMQSRDYVATPTFAKETATGCATNMAESDSGRKALRGPVVMPSAELDAHLHSKAAEIAESRHRKQRVLEESPPPSGHGNDLMTPPEVLLKRAWAEAEKLTKEKEGEAIRHWVRCTALSRIVYGDSHWQFAGSHIQLGKSYLDLEDLPEQALIHATKGRGILLLPGGHVTSHDPPPEAVHHLAVAHCVVGRAFTIQGKLVEAESSLLKAERTSQRFSKMQGGREDAQLDLDIAAAMGRLCFKRGKSELARDHFKKAVELCKAARGPKHHHLIPLLRELATVEWQDGCGDTPKAVELLEEALQIAESSHGADSEQVGGVLVALAGMAVEEHGIGSAEELLQRAHSIYSVVHGEHHEKSIICKEELCRILLTDQDSQERAIPLLEEVIAAKKRTFGDPSQEVAHSYKLLGSVYLTRGRVEQARKYLTNARDMYSLVLGAKHKETTTITKTLEVVSGSSALKDTARELETRPRFRTVV